MGVSDIKVLLESAGPAKRSWVSVGGAPTFRPSRPLFFLPIAFPSWGFLRPTFATRNLTLTGEPNRIFSNVRHGLEVLPETNPQFSPPSTPIQRL